MCAKFHSLKYGINTHYLYKNGFIVIFYFLNRIYLVCVCVYVNWCSNGMAHLWSSGNKLGESVISFYYVGSRLNLSHQAEPSHWLLIIRFIHVYNVIWSLSTFFHQNSTFLLHFPTTYRAGKKKTELDYTEYPFEALAPPDLWRHATRIWIKT